MNRQVTARGEETRARILETTLDVIAQDGVRAVTHRRVAADAPASLGLINYYFASTDTLIAAALETLAQRETERLNALTEQVLTCGDDVDAIVALLAGQIRERSRQLRRDTVVGLALTLEIPRERVSRDAFDGWELAQRGLYQTIAEVLGSDEPTEVASYLMASVEGLGMSAAIAAEPDLITRGAEVGLGHVLRSVKAPAPAGGGDASCSCSSLDASRSAP